MCVGCLGLPGRRGLSPTFFDRRDGSPVDRLEEEVSSEEENDRVGWTEKGGTWVLRYTLSFSFFFFSALSKVYHRFSLDSISRWFRVDGGFQWTCSMNHDGRKGKRV